jgi:tRNA (cmo5U34)-methyltransferase
MMSAWQQAGVARAFVEEHRGAIPYGVDQIRMLLQLVAHFRPESGLILDLGCGDGILARATLEICPKAEALLLAHSEPMLERARRAMAPFADRCVVRAADLAYPLSEQVAEASVDLVISGYAIHHLPHARKRALYAEILEALRPSGLFVNVEHVASPSERVEALFDALYVDHQAAVLQRPGEQAAAQHHGRPDKADNILALVETQLQWLREIGFENVDCFFKWLELAVFGGTKPGG